MQDSIEKINISTKKIESILHDAEKSAAAVHLIYIQDYSSGIRRVRHGTGFRYLLGNNKINDEATLERIKKLVIPPAWEEVWICALANGHLQATGIDARNRKQYKYHSQWNLLRNQTKFYRLHEFGKTLPFIRKQLDKDLSLPGLPLQKVLAAVVCIMEQTSIRVGNDAYEKLYGSFGLTTMKDRHLKLNGSKVQFTFKGKKGVAHNISFTSRRLAKIVKQCHDIPGKELFQYYDDSGKHKAIDSGMVNHYIKTISKQDFTAKDFRTWAGTVHAINEFKAITPYENKADIKKSINIVIDNVAKHLGNTRTVCKKYYIHPIIIDLYEANRLHSYFTQHRNGDNQGDIFHAEKLLLKILEGEGLVKK